MDWTKKNSNLRPGDIILFRKKKGFLRKFFSKFIKELDDFVLGVVDIWGNTFVMFREDGSIKLVNPDKIFKRKKYKNISIFTPKKVYSKNESTRYCNYMFGVDPKISKEPFLTMLANMVRPNTFDKPWKSSKSDIEINRYYKKKILKHG